MMPSSKSKETVSARVLPPPTGAISAGKDEKAELFICTATLQNNWNMERVVQNRLTNLYTQELLRNEFADFEIKILESYEIVLDEGAGHKGISALIDWVAIKL